MQKVLGLICLIPGTLLAAQQDGETESLPIELDPVVVVASKSPRPVSEIAGQVTVITAEQLQAELAEDLDAVFRYEPGIDLETQGTRFSASGVNIRGVGGNRVEIEVDGVPARDGFSIGAYSNGTRLLVEPDRIQRVEVLHGPASVMYGSNAIGGVVAIRTRDPDDLTGRSSSTSGFDVRAGYQGMNDSTVASANAAWTGNSHGFLAAATWRQGHEMDNASETADVDPQDWDSHDVLLRYTFDTAAGNRLRLTGQGNRREVRTDVRSQLGYGRRFRWTTELLGDDRDESSRLSAEYEWSAGQWKQGVIRAYVGQFDTEQKSLETRAKAPHPVSIERDFEFGQDLAGAEAFAFRDFQGNRAIHRLGIGVEWNRAEIDEKRDGLQTSLLTGETSTFILGESMPVRDFPLSTTTETGAWIQDEIEFADGQWQIMPALRWDRYTLDAKADTVWLEDNPDTEIVNLSESRVTPRLGLLWHPADQWSLYTQYTEGFRAPPFEDANIGFDLPLFGYRAIPNPDLESETSKAWEAGFRHVTPFHSLSAAVFHSDFDDFIESRALIGRDPETGDLLFQSINIGRARIRGIDVRYQQNLAAWSQALDGWNLSVAAWWSEGENRDSDQPLNSIAPPQAVLGAGWDSADGRWDVSLALTLTAEKKESEIDSTDEERFATPSWITLDLTAGWRPVQGLELRAGVFNLFDETYWRWLDVANRPANDPMNALLARPGRSFSVSARYTY